MSRVTPTPSEVAFARPDKVLVVDDEDDIRTLVRFNLDLAGFDVEVADTGAAAIEAVRARPPDVVVLDLMLPDVAGDEICRVIRRTPALADVAVMMLTAKDEEADRVRAFDAGIDDYVVKPFDIGELVLRTHALARCTVERRLALRVESPGERLRWGAVEIEPASERVFVDDVAVPLRPLEYRIVLLFMTNPGRVFTRQQLVGALFGAREATRRTIDAQLRGLRDKLGASAQLVETVHGIGYRLVGTVAR